MNDQGWRDITLNNSDTIVVCDQCHRSCCWHGEFMCEAAMSAGTVEMSVGVLRKLDFEHSDYWKKDKYERT